MAKFIKNLLNSISYFVLALSSIILLLYTGNTLAGVVTLAWNASSGPNLRGYRLYYGPASRSYRYNVDVGNNTTRTVVVQEGATYYFWLYETSRGSHNI